MPFSEITATSDVPPPMSSTIDPRASCTGMPAPIAAAIGSSIRYTSRAPADSADSLIARRSTWVEPHGTQTSTRGLGRNMRERCTLRMNCLSISSVIEKSAITPSLSGRTVTILPGVRPSMRLASAPTAATERGPPGPRSWRMATTEGSFRTMPWPRT